MKSCPPTSFSNEFTGSETDGWAGAQTSNTLLKLLGTRKGQSLVDNFARITDVDIRRDFVGLI
jgi:hypothetical protein